jgi:UDP-2,3-diacylglucosamine pyrophosphatase LpxH
VLPKKRQTSRILKEDKKMDRKRIYVSDVHMCAGRSLGSDKVYDWLGKTEADNFADFLDHLNKQDDVGEIILLGDTMDNWVCPIDEAPPTFNEILDASHNQKIVKNLKTLTENKKVIYMPGNHDMQVTKEVLQQEKYFPKIIFGGSALNKSRYRTSRLLAEHGSAYAMFNAPDPINNPGNRLPLGYFISRVAATKAARTGHADRHFWTYVDDFLELLGPQKLPQSVFEAILEEAGLSENAEIIMGTNDRKGNGKPVTASAVKEKYANLYEQWESHYGKGMAFKSVMAEIGYLGDLADYLSKKGDTNIIIFGHSHDNELDKDSWFVKDRIYANCGAWCDENKPCSFIETQKDDDNKFHYVRLMEWKERMVNKLGEKNVSL